MADYTNLSVGEKDELLGAVKESIAATEQQVQAAKKELEEALAKQDDDPNKSKAIEEALKKVPLAAAAATRVKEEADTKLTEPDPAETPGLGRTSERQFGQQKEAKEAADKILKDANELLESAQKAAEENPVDPAAGDPADGAPADGAAADDKSKTELAAEAIKKAEEEVTAARGEFDAAAAAPDGENKNKRLTDALANAQKAQNVAANAVEQAGAAVAAAGAARVAAAGEDQAAVDEAEAAAKAAEEVSLAATTAKTKADALVAEAEAIAKANPAGAGGAPAPPPPPADGGAPDGELKVAAVNFRKKDFNHIKDTITSDTMRDVIQYDLRAVTRSFGEMSTQYVKNSLAREPSFNLNKTTYLLIKFKYHYENTGETGSNDDEISLLTGQNGEGKNCWNEFKKMFHLVPRDDDAAAAGAGGAAPAAAAAGGAAPANLGATNAAAGNYPIGPIDNKNAENIEAKLFTCCNCKSPPNCKYATSDGSESQYSVAGILMQFKDTEVKTILKIMYDIQNDFIDFIKNVQNIFSKSDDVKRYLGIGAAGDPAGDPEIIEFDVTLGKYNNLNITPWKIAEGSNEFQFIDFDTKDENGLMVRVGGATTENWKECVVKKIDDTTGKCHITFEREGHRDDDPMLFKIVDKKRLRIKFTGNINDTCTNAAENLKKGDLDKVAELEPDRNSTNSKFLKMLEPLAKDPTQTDIDMLEVFAKALEPAGEEEPPVSDSGGGGRRARTLRKRKQKRVRRTLHKKSRQ